MYNYAFLLTFLYLCMGSLNISNTIKHFVYYKNINNVITHILNGILGVPCYLYTI